MAKKSLTKNSGGIKINEEDSSLAEFTRRPLPTEKEVEEFEEYIEEETREEEIEESLNEIYQDDAGHIVDVKKLDVRKKRGFFFWFFSLVFFTGIFGGAGYSAYNYLYVSGGSDATAVELSIEGKSEVIAGEDYFYTIYYRNNSNVRMNDVKLEVKLPDNFIIMDFNPDTEKNDPAIWDIESLPPYYNGMIRIKGMLLGKEKENSSIYATLRYVPENFSSVFKKEAAFSSLINNIGLDIDYDSIKTVLVDEKNEIEIAYSAKDNSFIKNFRITFEPQENIKIIGMRSGDQAEDKIEELRPGVWNIENVDNEHKNLKIEFQFTSKVSDSQTVNLNIETGAQNAKGEEVYYLIAKKEIEYEVMKSDLNLTMIVNGSREGDSVDFGEKLNFSLVYNNKGEATMRDVVIMAVLESKFLDWSKLEMKQPGKEKGNTITWTKEHLPGLESLDVNQEGTIDFSINVADLNKIEPGANYEIKSYARYNVGKSEEDKDESEEKTEDNISNTVLNIINSDLRLNEELRYFNEDNIPVGTGPNPPRVGEGSSFKVYWTITNNLHELNDLVVKTKLPDGVTWNGKERATVGSVYYNDSENEIIWNVGRLPVTVFQTNAEFSINVNPSEDHRNKIMVLVSGTKASAMDSVTKKTLIQEAKAKTSRLEDDSLGGSDGLVR